MSQLNTALETTPGFSGLALEDILSGQPSYINRVNGRLGLAVATTEEKATCVGLARSAILTGSIGDVDDEQHYEADWTTITGTVNLAVGQVYYLDTTIPGRLTTVAPLEAEIGKFSVVVGTAVSTKILEINLQPPIGL